jgi:hypothetical protein
MKIERINVNAVVYSTEDMEKVGEAIATLFPFEFEIEITDATGHYGNPLKFLEVKLTKKREIQEFLEHFVSSLSEEDIQYLLETLEDRVDEEGVLHLRIDKQRAYLGELGIVERGDAIVVRIKIVTYPAKREKIIEAARNLIRISFAPQNTQG